MNASDTNTPSKKMLWTGRILTGLAGAFMIMDGVMKLVKPQPVMEATMKLGFPASSISGIGIALLFCTALYLLPSTAVFGAVLLTGYLGGAVASQVRINAPLFDTVFPILFVIIVWAGIFLRDARLRALVPFRCS